MTEQQYKEQNAKGFEGDHFIGEKVKELTQAYKSSLIIETGSYMGNTTKKFSEILPTMSCEISQQYYQIALKNCNGLNVSIYNNNSPKFLHEIMPSICDKSVFFWLDAHWNGTPLIEELKELSAMKVPPVIGIHDFKVPGRPDLGFDSYNGQDYEFEWIAPYLDAIYTKGYTIEYNTQAVGAKRGVIYIKPKKPRGRPKK